MGDPLFQGSRHKALLTGPTLQGNKRTTPDPDPINLTPGCGNDHHLQGASSFARSHCSSCQVDVQNVPPQDRFESVFAANAILPPKYEVHHESLWQPAITVGQQQHHQKQDHQIDESFNRFQSSDTRSGSSSFRHTTTQTCLACLRTKCRCAHTPDADVSSLSHCPSSRLPHSATDSRLPSLLTRLGCDYRNRQ